MNRYGTALALWQRKHSKTDAELAERSMSTAFPLLTTPAISKTNASPATTRARSSIMTV